MLKFSDRLSIVDNADLMVLNYMLGGTSFVSHFANIWPVGTGLGGTWFLVYR